ncbi:MAG: hypothetical protein OEW75_16325, partial [Cyclobacteriaceae bacterium]|nr:hypothetical protein [Cyclobacteriaceae bacterium]
TDAYFAPNNDLYLLNNQGSSLWLYKNNSAKEVIKPTEKLNVITVSKDGKDLYGGSAAGKVILYDLNNNYNSKIIFQKDQTSITAINTNNKNDLVFGDNLGLTHFRINGKFSVKPSHTAPITEVDFSEDGRFMATASRDRTIRLWNMSQLNQVPVELRDHDAQVTSIAFTPDNNQLMAGMYNASIKNWPTRIDEMSSLMCGNNHIIRNMSEDEWIQYVGELTKIPYEVTCQGLTVLSNQEETNEQ